MSAPLLATSAPLLATSAPPRARSRPLCATAPLRATAAAFGLWLAGCGAMPDPAAIRDARPTRLQRGERMVVEASRPLFTVGAATTVSLDALGVTLPARAIAPDRVVATLDDDQRASGPTTVTVLQGARRWTSDARVPFDVELCAPSLHRLANGWTRLRGPPWLWLALALLAAAALVAAPLPVLAGLIVVWERKISGYMGSRFGPNRVGPNGWLQWLADGLKLLMKEDLVPAAADARLFRAAPYLAFLGLFLTFIVLPFSRYAIVADLDVGLLFLLAVTALVVVSILVGGWSSNSKWALLGGMRSAAQIVSYELPASVALLTIATRTGSLSTQRIVAAQGGWPWQWNLFADPFTFVAFFIWFVSALAEGNRTPFDLPEAESELVAGYTTEYSGFRFSLYPLVEWVNIAVIGAIGTLLFLGGWRLPFVTTAMIDAHPWLDALGFAAFVVKDVAVVFVVIWIRWTLPRFRVDQMMSLCWTYFIPFSFACFVGELLWVWLVPSTIARAAALALFALCGVGGGAWFLGRVRDNARRYQDLVLNDALGRGPR
jgi:NADH-quinone oxidoreductase subunit H